MRALLLLAALANTWTPQPGAVGPDLRDPTLLYDGVRNRIVVVGGVLPDGTLSTALYSYDAVSGWVDLAPASPPPPRIRAAATADTAGRIVLFGGHFPGGSAVDETWLYDPVANAWSQVALSPALAPSPRYDAAIDYDPVRRKATLYGGCCTSHSDEVWTFDFDARKWALVSGGIGDAGRYRHHWVYEPRSRRFVLDGGHYGEDTWTFDPQGGVWSPQDAPDALPATRAHSRMAYAGWGGILLYGGETTTATWPDEPTPFLDTWIFHPETGRWSSVGPNVDPGPRQSHALVHHGSSGDVVLFDRGEIWTYRFGIQVTSDAAAPTVPVGLHAPWSGEAAFSWEPSTDDVLVAGYRIFRDGEPIAAVTGTAFRDGYALDDTTYDYAVEAYDMPGNGSGRSGGLVIAVESHWEGSCLQTSFTGCSVACADSRIALAPVPLALLALVALRVSVRRRVAADRRI